MKDNLEGILVVNFTCHVHHKGTQIFAQTLFRIYLWGCSWMRLTFESIDWGKKVILPNVGGPYPISQSCCSNRTTVFLTSNRELLLPDFLDLGHQFLSDLDDSYTLGSLGSQAFGLELPCQFRVSTNWGPWNSQPALVHQPVSYNKYIVILN